MKKKTFYAVAMTIFNDGHVTINHAGCAIDYFKPENKVKDTPRCVRYIDWFDSKDEADKFIANNTL